MEQTAQAHCDSLASSDKTTADEWTVFAKVCGEMKAFLPESAVFKELQGDASERSDALRQDACRERLENAVRALLELRDEQAMGIESQQAFVEAWQKFSGSELSRDDDLSQLLELLAARIEKSMIATLAVPEKDSNPKQLESWGEFVDVVQELLEAVS